MTIDQVKSLESVALQDIRQARTAEELELLRVKYLGRKGDLTQVLRGLKDQDPELRRLLGQEANRVKTALEAALDQALSALKTAARLARHPCRRRHPAGAAPAPGPAPPVEPHHGRGLRHLPPPGL